MSFFSAENLTSGYGRDHTIEKISFEMEKGILLGILGANGSGKTTLIKTICGILPHEGICTLEGCRLETLSPRQIAKKCSYIPQRSGISIDLSVLDVVLMGFNSRLGLLEHPDHGMRLAAQNALEQVGLSGKEEMNYLHLSEGQKQLCILARTLVSESRLLLLDEPESALDFRLRYRMLDILQNWVSETNGGAIITLHDPELALNYCDQLLLMANGNVLGMLAPREDSHAYMEEILNQIYGAVSLQICKTRNGVSRLVMLKEDEE